MNAPMYYWNDEDDLYLKKKKRFDSNDNLNSYLKSICVQNLFHRIHTDDSSMMNASIEYDIWDHPIVEMVDYRNRSYMAYHQSVSACEPSGIQGSFEESK